MGHIVKAVPVVLEEVHLAWLVGRTVTDWNFHEPTLWVVLFSAGGYVQTDGLWRLLKDRRIIASSEDHMQQFGLPQPVDSGADARSHTLHSTVLTAQIGDQAPDLRITFDNECVLEFIVSSQGHECWQMCDPDGVATVVTGSRHASTWQEKLQNRPQ
jgi:hypothetical protein